MDTIIKFETSGTCARKINIVISKHGIIKDLQFLGGCSGGLEALAIMCKGSRTKDIAYKLNGIKCGNKESSCADQLSKALVLNILGGCNGSE